VLGQRCVDGKSNEIAAVPELLDQLTLQNSIVILDAMGCQTAIAEKILARGGDYLLTLKGNGTVRNFVYAGRLIPLRPWLL
jgi:predicted transposase YbfD/YdcC